MRWQYHSEIIPAHTGNIHESFSAHMIQKFDEHLNAKGSREWELIQILPVSMGYLAFYKRAMS